MVSVCVCVCVHLQTINYTNKNDIHLDAGRGGYVYIPPGCIKREIKRTNKLGGSTYFQQHHRTNLHPKKCTQHMYLVLDLETTNKHRA